MRRGLVIAAGWAGGVVAAATFGVTTVSALGAGPGPGGPLSQAEVNDRLAKAPASTAQPTPDPTVATSGNTVNPGRQYFTLSGGGLWASCSGGLATIETMTPRSGYRLDGYERGPASVATVRFKQDVERGHASEYRVSVTCVDGVPHATEVLHD